MSKLLDKIRKASTIKETAILESQVLFTQVDETPTDILALNIALSGCIDGGLKSGILTLAGPSRHFKQMYALVMASAYLRKHKEAVLLFYDSEFGSPVSYFTSVGIDPARVVHTPVKSLEQLKFDITQQLESIERGDKLFILIDSIGNLASTKEVNNAIEQHSALDMTRAKEAKSLYRIITPYLRLKDIPLVQVGHIYMCGTENMMVKTPMGDRSLSEFSIGDDVYTSSGVEKVQNIFKYENVPVTRIEMEDGSILEFTEFHRFKVNGQWVCVSDIDVGMELDTISI